MRPADLPPAERFPHGTRARYVSGCRCDACLEAIRLDAAERRRRVHEAAAEVRPNPGPPAFKVFHRTRRDGTPYEIRARACPGTGGKPCVAGGAWLKGREVCVGCVHRAAVWNGMVPAAPVRAHLKRLARQGVGHKSVAAACDVSKTVLGDVLWGGKKLVRRRTADRVLAVTKDAIADGGRIDAAPTWKLIGELLEMGMTRSAIARELGQRSAVLQLSRHLVEARSALAVRKLHARVKAQGEGGFVRDASDPRYVAADAVAALLEELRELGISASEIRRRLGLVLKPRCTPGTFRRLRDLRAASLRQREVDERAARLRAVEEGGEGGVARICPDCGYTHDLEERRAALRRMLPCTAEDLREAHPCWWDGRRSAARERILYRDLRAVGAERTSGTWGIPDTAKDERSAA